MGGLKAPKEWQESPEEGVRDQDKDAPRFHQKWGTHLIICKSKRTKILLKERTVLCFGAKREVATNFGQKQEEDRGLVVHPAPDWGSSHAFSPKWLASVGQEPLTFPVGCGGLHVYMVCSWSCLAGVRVFLSCGFQNYLPTNSSLSLWKRRVCPSEAMC